MNAHPRSAACRSDLILARATASCAPVKKGIDDHRGGHEGRALGARSSTCSATWTIRPRRSPTCSGCASASPSRLAGRRIRRELSLLARRTRSRSRVPGRGLMHAAQRFGAHVTLAQPRAIAARGADGRRGPATRAESAARSRGALERTEAFEARRRSTEVLGALELMLERVAANRRGDRPRWPDSRGGRAAPPPAHSSQGRGATGTESWRGRGARWA